MRRLLIALAMLSTAWAGSPSRIVSIGGASTETVFALGQGALLVGVDSTSTFPAEAVHLPQVGYQRALSAEGIAALSPDLVILPATAGPPAVIQQLEGLHIPMLRLEEGHTISAAAARIRAIGAALEQREAADRLATKLEGAAAALPAVSRRPRVLFILSAGGRAPMVAGTETAADAAIHLAGGKNVAEGFRGYKPLSPEALVTLDPEILVTTSRTMGSQQNPSELLPGLEHTTAGRTGRMIVMDDLYLLGFGPRTGEALEELSRHFRSDALQAGR